MDVIVAIGELCFKFLISNNNMKNQWYKKVFLIYKNLIYLFFTLILVLFCFLHFTFIYIMTSPRTGTDILSDLSLPRYILKTFFVLYGQATIATA